MAQSMLTDVSLWIKLSMQTYFFEELKPEILFSWKQQTKPKIITGKSYSHEITVDLQNLFSVRNNFFWININLLHSITSVYERMNEWMKIFI